jgi:hypothetical protein
MLYFSFCPDFKTPELKERNDNAVRRQGAVGPLEPLDTNLQNKNICPKGTMLVSNSN